MQAGKFTEIFWKIHRMNCALPILLQRVFQCDLIQREKNSMTSKPKRVIIFIWKNRKLSGRGFFLWVVWANQSAWSGTVCHVSWILISVMLQICLLLSYSLPLQKPLKSRPHTGILEWKKVKRIISIFNKDFFSLWDDWRRSWLNGVLSLSIFNSHNSVLFHIYSHSCRVCLSGLFSADVVVS